MYKVGDKVIVVNALKSKQHIINHVGIIDKVNPKEQYCYHINFKANNINVTNGLSWWSYDNLKLLEISEEDYEAILEETNSEENSGTYDHYLKYNENKENEKYGWKYITYTKYIAYTELVITIIATLVNFGAATGSDSQMSGSFAFISTFGILIGGLVTFIFLMLLASIAENIVHIRKNTENK
jgi:hypothetical protein